jgi:CubicO group peptidase (beta-lactamase class C family)
MFIRGFLRCPWLLAAALIVLHALAAFAQPGPGRGGRAGRPVARPARAQAIADGILMPPIEEKKLVGLEVGVVCGGRALVNKGYGVTSRESQSAPNENTQFYIQSLSKAITAVGAMILVDDGKLKLEAPASRYLKDLPRSWQPITIAQFMSHSSGIPELAQKLPTFEEMLRKADNEPLAFKPGSRQQYNNFNFAVIGKVIEVETCQPARHGKAGLSRSLRHAGLVRTKQPGCLGGFQEWRRRGIPQHLLIRSRAS